MVSNSNKARMNCQFKLYKKNIIQILYTINLLGSVDAQCKQLGDGKQKVKYKIHILDKNNELHGAVDMHKPWIPGCNCRFIATSNLSHRVKLVIIITKLT